MISIQQYFGKPHSADEVQSAEDLLERREALIEEAIASGAFNREICPHTGSEISGSAGGDGDGGFRTPSSVTGGPGSAHRKAQAIDTYDPGDHLDAWLDAFDREGGMRNEVLERHGLYREASSATPGWCHLQTLAVGSGRRTFNP